ncbi:MULTISPECIES: trigger factor [Leeuwenhoekiella]|mgnify:FL=1|uniref:trigger factor n=2 Tax=Flavobacteriaceae TaxID=49546 RepID=UPI0023553C3C|nr:trigger factor [Leeuwenhoekiella blandensis]|tara:strand:+ start:98499 stop:99821 length:1323 start_codon:yes stop_codon:yes gene_type:complete
MNITRENIDDLNAVLKVDIAKDDYNEKVQKVLKDYRKSANIPGFRKGHVPMGLVQKQYGKAVLVDEVNKLLQDSLQKYLTEEKLDVLGNPLPKDQEDLNWDAGDYTFEFELGLAPKFEVDLQPKKAITSYTIVVDDKMVDNQITTIQKQYGKITSKQEVEKDDEVSGSFVNEEAEFEKKTMFEVAKLKGKANTSAFVGAKVGDTVTVSTKGLFEEAGDYRSFLGLSEEEAKEKNLEVSFTIEEVNRREPADLDQELFDKLYGPGVITSVTELKEKIKEEGENQFKQQSDQQLLNDVTERLIENTEFDLPAEFLKKWIQRSGEKELTFEEAVEEYERSEKGLRYQLIEGKIIADNELQITFEEIKAYAKEMIKAQMAQFGQNDPKDEELEGIAARILSNQDEVKRLSEQLMNKKLLDFFKENVKLKEKEVTFDEFVKEVYN